ncbi:hypothetical protein [Paraburkholderia azotifigens]|uniref:Uncharacterized protein n=1 Tax=Paraburkholderia azotifigens TaxID=2057004 RepID=A0A5C6V7N2_9BURK|nr:hypothetical protein [Paraburkholderia azotifigens]TXC81047.1 hypothetical protein FRZ40_43415 [Paraburkholderia azotifigens]
MDLCLAGKDAADADFPAQGKFRLISDFKLRINCFGVYSEKMPSGGDIVSEISPIYNSCR